MISQESPCIIFALDGVANEIVDGVCVFLLGIAKFPAGRGKAEAIRRGKVAKNINNQFNWNVHDKGHTEYVASVSKLIRNECIW